MLQTTDDRRIYDSKDPNVAQSHSGKKCVYSKYMLKTMAAFEIVIRFVHCTNMTPYCSRGVDCLCTVMLFISVAEVFNESREIVRNSRLVSSHLLVRVTSYRSRHER